MSDPYAELGLKRGATDEEIKAAFRRLAHVHHPDKQTTAASRAPRWRKVAPVTRGHSGKWRKCGTCPFDWYRRQF